MAVRHLFYFDQFDPECTYSSYTFEKKPVSNRKEMFSRGFTDTFVIFLI